MSYVDGNTSQFQDDQIEDISYLSFSYPLMSSTSYPVEDSNTPYTLKRCNRIPYTQRFSYMTEEELDPSRWSPGYSPGYVTLSSLLKRQRQRQDSESSEEPDRKRWTSVFSPRKISSILKRRRNDSLNSDNCSISSDLTASNSLNNSINESQIDSQNYSQNDSQNDTRNSPFPWLNILSRSSTRNSISDESIELETASEISECPENCSKTDESSSKTDESSLLSKVWSSMPNLAMPKMPQRSWWCKTCERPRDSCVCICIVL